MNGNSLRKTFKIYLVREKTNTSNGRKGTGIKRKRIKQYIYTLFSCIINAKHKSWKHPLHHPKKIIAN